MSLFATKHQPLIKQIIRDVKEHDTEIFDSLSTFIKSMVYETDYFVEIESALILGRKSPQPAEEIA